MLPKERRWPPATVMQLCCGGWHWADSKPSTAIHNEDLTAYWGSCHQTHSPAPSAPLNRWHKPGTWLLITHILDLPGVVLPCSLVLPAFPPTFSCRFLQKPVVLLVKLNPMEHKKPLPPGGHIHPHHCSQHCWVPPAPSQGPSDKATRMGSQQHVFHLARLLVSVKGSGMQNLNCLFQVTRSCFWQGQTALYGEMCKKKIRAVVIAILPASRSTSAVYPKTQASFFSKKPQCELRPKLIPCTDHTSLAGWWMLHHDTLLLLSGKNL